ncbi:MAG: DUF4166 domain-containing protein [Sphingorhabdus sp.]
MKRIVVIGGYGGFGAKVSQLLAEDGHKIVVAGRSLVKATAFCAQFSSEAMQPMALDREQIDADGLRSLDACLLIDASGPFQVQDFHVPKACIQAGIHYLDLSDGRAFVNGISSLNREAMEAQTCVVSGASTLPALGTAVTDCLARDMDIVKAIRTSLSASNRLNASRSVTEAILSYAGQNISIWRGGKSEEATGLQETRRVSYQIKGLRPHVRSVRLCDVPDLDSLPSRYAGKPASEFRAGSDIRVLDFLLWICTWPVVWGWLKNLSRFTFPALLAQRFFSIFGGDRSAMEVRLFGRLGANALERKWTVIADNGDGMWIPALAAPLLARRIVSGELEFGARSSSGLLDLKLFQPYFDRYAIQTEIVEQPASDYLYRRVMGQDFDLLPPAVQYAHEVLGDHGMIGSTQVIRGRNALAVLVARLFRFPDSGTNLPAHVHMREEKGVETWVRNFDGQRFASTLCQMGNLLSERFGPFNFAMALRRTNDGLSMHMRKAYFLGMRFPLALAPRIQAREYEADGRFHFDVDIALPVIGRIILYQGHLQPMDLDNHAQEQSHAQH